ncbi:AbrB/MazE/SpoVT family DNA-binding domain-containing protein [Salicibibacter cibarius]|uniref:AbrB/MazE/SpoVT family DNA-binding domain-containing protein n=1 Tax=Salicibibacter cibarius TaxID=2743000 RepID=A0A7T7C9V4_9BACI|nr:AbrB/MazE/SpoVT family DNA-binding domain-containing protein [Salicibibacter cibarius]QQK74180.1 AbrB/MazE/SpoVT family DNA-binding domain-containing protein [Salicibibacter cibarius]
MEKRTEYRQLNRGGLTIPKNLREKIGLEDDDLVTIHEEQGRLVLERGQVIPASQAWFWTEEWQEGEKEAEEDIKAGRVKKFDNVHDLIADLESDDQFDGDER